MPVEPFRAVCRAVLGAIVLAGVTAAPAGAQFGSIFGDSPPRPPSSVPRDERYPAPPPRRQAPPPPQQQLPPPPVVEQPPPAPPPTQQAVVPARPGVVDVQSQDLPPPSGAPGMPAAPGVPGSPAAPAAEPTALPGGQTVPPPGTPGPAGGGTTVRPRGAPPQPANTAPQPGDEIVTEMPSQKIPNPTAVFSGLDKITGRITTFDVAINETVQFGALQVTPRVCYTRPPTEAPNTDSFIEVDEVTLQGEVKRIFTGWTFAASPGLRGVEHPIYDIWLADCKGATPAVAEAPPVAPPPLRPTQQPRAQGQQGAQQPQQRPAQPRPAQPRAAQPVPPPTFAR